MNFAVNSKPGVVGKSNWMLIGLTALGVIAAALFFWFDSTGADNGARLFRGKPESEWVKNLKYNDDEQVKEWRSYGEEGVQVLIRGLERANHPGERNYRRFHRVVPYWVSRWMPDAKDDSTRASRMTLTSLIASLGSDAKSATPIMIRLLKQDENESVREIVMCYFNSTEDEKCLLNQLPAQQKQDLLPVFISAVRDSEQMRNNAAISLGFYSEQRKIVAPVLMGALHDSQPAVVLVAAKSLARVAPDLITNAQTAEIIAEILKNPDDQIAYRAAELLGEMNAEPSIAVPALISGMTNASRIVAVDSTLALTKFNQPADLILPALNAAMQGTNLSKWLRPVVKKKIESLAALSKN